MMNDKEYLVPGIPDEMFIRGKVPMTKEEIRTLTISKLKLKKESRVLDVGAGTGSISIECAFLCPKGKIYALERNAEGVKLIKNNKDKFGLNNIEIIEGTAPESMNTLNNIDRIIIGGSGGKIKEIICASHNILSDNGIIVINAILLETMYLSLKYLKCYGYRNIDLIQISISKKKLLGAKTSLTSLNPVFIIWAKK